MNKNILNTVLVFCSTLTLFACASGNKVPTSNPVDDGKTEVPGGPVACGTLTAHPGDTVTCSIEGFEDGDTLFVGETPVEVVRQEDGSLQFTIPPMPAGHAPISYAHGADDPVVVQQDFTVAPPPAPSAPTPSEPVPTPDPPANQPQCVADTDCAAGHVCLEGACTAATVIIEPTPPPPAPPVMPDSPPAEPPAPPVCNNGICETGETTDNCTMDCPAPPPVLVPAVCGNDLCEDGETSTSCESDCAPSLEGTTGLHAQVLGLVKVQWKCPSNAQECYIYGPFNRKSGDDTCGLELGRYLAVNDLATGGAALEEGSGDYETYQDYVTGAACLADGSNCEGFSPDVEDVTIRCRINLQGTEGIFYTRIHQKRQKFIIVAKSIDGTYVSKDRDLDAPDPEINDLRVSLQDHAPVIDISFYYKNALVPPSLEYCVIPPSKGGDVTDFLPGSGHFSRSCQLNPILPPRIDVWGIGDGTTRELTIDCDTPELIFKMTTLNRSGTSTPICSNGEDSHCEHNDMLGDATLKGTASRRCTIREKESTVESQEKTFGFGKEDIINKFVKTLIQPVLDSKVGPYVKDLEIRGLSSPPRCQGTSGVLSLDDPQITIVDAEANMTKKLLRDHECFQYEFRVHDFGGILLPVKTKNLSYVPHLEVNNRQFDSTNLGAANRYWGGDWLDDKCQYDWPGDECDNCIGGSSCGTGWCQFEMTCSNYGAFHPRQVTWNWEAKNCKTLKEYYSTGTSGTSVSSYSSTTSSDSYPLKTGTISKLQVPQGADFRMVCESFDPSQPDVSVDFRFGQCDRGRCVVTYD